MCAFGFVFLIAGASSMRRDGKAGRLSGNGSIYSSSSSSVPSASDTEEEQELRFTSEEGQEVVQEDQQGADSSSTGKKRSTCGASGPMFLRCP
jgi:hypothetical protein